MLASVSQSQAYSAVQRSRDEPVRFYFKLTCDLWLWGNWRAGFRPGSSGAGSGVACVGSLPVELRNGQLCKRAQKQEKLYGYVAGVFSVDWYVVFRRRGSCLPDRQVDYGYFV